jgi:hypothetical protein
VAGGHAVGVEDDGLDPGAEAVGAAELSEMLECLQGGGLGEIFGIVAVSAEGGSLAEDEA